MRDRTIAALICLCALAGCTTDDRPSPVVVDSRMPVVIDTNTHRIVHPPRRHATGKVDPVDQQPGRERNFGPETRLETGHKDRLAAVLDAFRASEPRGVQPFLALAKPRKAKAAAAAPEWLGADNSDTTLSPEPHDLNRETPRGVADADGGYRLNFEDAEIKDVMQAVLGKVLGLNYTIAPNVTGRITISSAAAQSRAELLTTIETVLSLQGLSLTKNGNMYRIAPLSLGGGSLDQTGTEPGFGISVVPVQYSSVASMSKLLSGFLVEADGIRIETTSNAIIVRGPGPRREEIVRAIKAFDGDWMHQQSVSVVELRRSRPEEVVAELTRIFDADLNGEAAGVIQFKPIKRLRSVMVISRNPGLVKRAANWIRRLDHQDTSAVDSVFIYRPRYRSAQELAKLVNGLFGGSGGQSQSGNVAFQDNNTPGQGSTSQGSQAGTLGTSSASFAGGLGSSTGSSLGGGGGGLGTGGSGLGSGTGGAGLSAGTGGTGSSSSFGNTSGAGGSGNGLSGNAADPIEAGQGQKGNGSMHLSLTADTSNNTIVAYTDGESYAKVQSVLKQLDVAPLQVAINVIIAEVQLNDELKYGIQFYLNAHHNLGQLSLGDATASAASGIASKFPGFNFLIGGKSSPDVVISALDSISKVHILSTPSIVVMENKPATLEVGNQVPIVTQAATSNLTPDAPTVNSVQYLDTGIILKIIPRIGTNGTVAMDVDQVISGVVPNANGSTDTSLTPTISKRRIASAIAVRSGQSVLLAGLINDTRSQSKGQVPFLSSGLGDLLGNKDNSFSRSELVVFIRPIIVRDGQDATEVADEFKTHLKAMNVRNPPIYKP